MIANSESRAFVTDSLAEGVGVDWMGVEVAVGVEVGQKVIVGRIVGVSVGSVGVGVFFALITIFCPG